MKGQINKNCLIKQRTVQRFQPFYLSWYRVFDENIFLASKFFCGGPLDSGAVFGQATVKRLLGIFRLRLGNRGENEGGDR